MLRCRSGSGLFFAICCAALFLSGPSPVRAEHQHVEADLLIAGGTESGCAAAVQAARMGVKSIVLVNDIEWLGGQFSAEGLVAIDENRGPQGYDQTVPFHRSGLFREVIDRIEHINRTKYGQARPGNTHVITTCRPSDAAEVFRELLEPYVRSGRVRILSHWSPVAAEVEPATSALTSVRFHSDRTPDDVLTVSARLTIDATDWGDVIKAAGADYEFGPDLKSKYGEPRAPESREAFPITDMNPITYCMVINETDEYRPIDRPAGYDPRNYRTHKWPKDPLWIYRSRRVIDRYGFRNVTHPDVVLLCFPAFDYPLDVLPKSVADAIDALEPGASKKNIVQMTRAQRQTIFDDAKRSALGYLYFLQTEVHDAMPDRTHSFRRFQLTDEFGTPDRLPFKPYVRESLRLKAEYMMRQQDTTGVGGNARNFAQVMYHDAVACWQFEYDFHPTKRVFIDGDPAGPWINEFRPNRTWGPPYSGLSQFPLRSLVPVKINGLLGAQKNLGYSSIVSAAVRLHDQSMAIGAASGAVAAVSLSARVEPREIPWSRKLLSQVQAGLCRRLDGGVPQLLWPFRDVEPEHPAFEAINRLAVRGALPIKPRETTFQPDAPANEAWKQEVLAMTQAGLTEPLPEALRSSSSVTRGEFARAVLSAIEDIPERPFERLDPRDADRDGIADQDDPLPLLAAPSSWPDQTLPRETDGHPDQKPGAHPDEKLVNFAGPGAKPAAGFVTDDGRPFDAARGFGWTRDIRDNHRRRQQVEGDWRDAFLFTRSHDTWELSLPDGKYEVTVCVGDSGHEQTGQNVTIEGVAAIRNQTTAAGEWCENTVEVEVRDGRLTVEIGRPGGSTNTCLNWLRVTPTGAR